MATAGVSRRILYTEFIRRRFSQYGKFTGACPIEAADPEGRCASEDSFAAESQPLFRWRTLATAGPEQCILATAM
jgi:hypothetical protein